MKFAYVPLLCVQFFLSNRAVYLLLWNIRLGYEHAGLDFWLSSIACHAPKAPVLIVGSHKDQVSSVQLYLALTQWLCFWTACKNNNLIWHFLNCLSCRILRSHKVFLSREFDKQPTIAGMTKKQTWISTANK